MIDIPLWKSDALSPMAPRSYDEMVEILAAIASRPWHPPVHVMGRKEWEWWQAHPEEARIRFGAPLG